jgi:hypothetical protein
LKVGNIQNGFSEVWSSDGIQHEFSEMSAEMVHAGLVEWSLPGQGAWSADESAGLSDAESALYVLYQ